MCAVICADAVIEIQGDSNIKDIEPKKKSSGPKQVESLECQENGQDSVKEQTWANEF